MKVQEFIDNFLMPGTVIVLKYIDVTGEQETKAVEFGHKDYEGMKWKDKEVSYIYALDKDVLEIICDEQ